MISSYDSYQKRRLISSYFSVVLSIFLVLFLLGVLGLFVINSKKLANQFREGITMTVFLSEDANDTIVNSFKEELKAAKYVKSSKYVTKEEAAQTHTKDLGEDFVTFLGANPLQNSFDINLKAEYVNKKNVDKIESDFRQNPYVSDIGYDTVLMDMVNENIEKISYWILIASGILTLVAVLLINSSMRLSIHSNRFIIKTMQMVGATKSFIRMPFIIRSIVLGLIGALIAIIALVASLFTLNENFPTLNLMDEPASIGLVLAGMLLLGVLISGISTFFATQRFLNLRTDELY